MTGILDAARAHFDGAKNREIDVPEWGAKLYFDPVTVLQRTKFAKKLDAGNLTGAVDVLIAKCRTAEGAPAFSYADEKALLTEVDSGIVLRIARTILGTAKAGADEVREAEGN